MIVVGDKWNNKDTGELVVVDWISEALVSYLRPSHSGEKMVNTTRKMLFLQDFERDVLDERMNDGIEPVAVGLSSL